MNVEVRRFENTVHETGVAVPDRVDVTYELGAVIDGAWVRFSSVTQGQVDVAKVASPETADQAPSEADQGPTMQDVTPTPAPQAEAASAGGGATA